MPRKPRVEFRGAFYHVIARGNHREAIFHDDLDRHRYLARLEQYRARYDFRIHAYALMTNHVHLLLQTVEAPLSKIMQGLQCTYARFYNWRYRQAGHLFQGRYKAILCDRDAYLLELVRYIHLNPARLPIPIDPWTYPWSSHRAYLGEPSPVTVETSLVLRQFGGHVATARQRYLAFLAAGVGIGHQRKFYEEGDEEFAGEAASRARREGGAGSQGPGASFDLLVRAVAQACGADPGLLLHQDRRRRWLQARTLLVYLAREWGRLDIRELGRHIHRDPSSVSRLYSHYLDHPDPAAEARVEGWLRRNANTQA